jgi:murein DD-endopeptidase MepM/ murein hydrolase activator NlpD
MALFRKKKGTNENSDIDRAHPNWLVAATWIIAGLMVGLMVFSLYEYFSGRSLIAFINKPGQPTGNSGVSSLPDFTPTKPYQAIERSTNPDTVLPVGSRKGVVQYTVDIGDSLFGIAEQYEIEPESVLWANYDTLQDDPHLISVGAKLNIPPVDGILYQWKDGNELDKVAAEYHGIVDDILLYPGNNLDMTDPVVEPGAFLMIPDGWRPLQPWVVPVVAGDDAGVTAQIAGPGSCTPAGGNYGTYSFVWPTPYYGSVTGNDYWGGHQAIDCECYEGDSIFASDSGVVIYSGPIGGGYGNLVAIDHQNGYLTLYAHLSGFNVGCGQSITQGQVVGFCGSTGNSTGTHLHFEVRQDGGFINPWYVLQ